MADWLRWLMKTVNKMIIVINDLSLMIGSICNSEYQNTALTVKNELPIRH